MRKNCCNGITFMGMLFIALMALKLTNYIDWSWWLISLPLMLKVGVAITQLKKDVKYE